LHTCYKQIDRFHKIQELVQALAERLLAVASAVHQELSLDSANSSAAQWRTIIHGDFKTANLFFSPTAGVRP